jgi:uncharacterized protein (TIGR02452 family)
VASRSQRAKIAEETVAIANAGSYLAPTGVTISIRESVEYSKKNSRLFTPADWNSLRSQADAAMIGQDFATRFEVQSETTFTAARRLVARLGPHKVAALNFASAKNPGGGFLGGSQAQEECLARASALYPSLLTQPRYYDANRAGRSSLYSDHLIVSPKVCVFRDDEDRLLDEPWEVTIITSPAPNAGAIAENSPVELPRVESVFRQRIEQVLSVAVVTGQTGLVLGAWGCGVFRNDPSMVARLFSEFLLKQGRFAKAFDQISFAVLDRQGDTLQAFERMLSSDATPEIGPG